LSEVLRREEEAAETAPPRTDSAAAAVVVREIRRMQRENRRKALGLSPSAAQSAQSPPQASLASLRAEARDWLRRAAEQGHGAAAVRLGNMCLAERQLSEAEAWYRKGVAARHADAAFNLGLLLYEHQSPAAAAEWFRLAADWGDAAAMTWLGHAHRVGDGVHVDAAESLRLLQAAAGLEHGPALTYLWRLFASGDAAAAVAADAQRAAEYLRRAAAARDADALFALGDAHYHGSDGCPRDAARALEFFLAAGDAGEHPEALCNAAAMLFRGEGAPSDHRRAFDLYQRAAEAGSRDAWRNLAHMYLHGLGTEQSERAARYILETIERAAPPPPD
jgi:TPR repeat protein